MFIISLLLLVTACKGLTVCVSSIHKFKVTSASILHAHSWRRPDIATERDINLLIDMPGAIFRYLFWIASIDLDSVRSNYGT